MQLLFRRWNYSKAMSYEMYWNTFLIVHGTWNIYLFTRLWICINMSVSWCKLRKSLWTVSVFLLSTANRLRWTKSKFFQWSLVRLECIYTNFIYIVWKKKQQQQSLSNSLITHYGKIKISQPHRQMQL